MEIFLYKKLIELIENCEKSYKQTCSTQKIPVQGCQLSRIIRETPDFELFLPVSRLESEISRIIAEVCHFLKIRLSDNEISNILRCFSYLTVNIERFVTNSGMPL